MRPIGRNQDNRNDPYLARAAARSYQHRGWKPVPIPVGKKRPTIADWPTRTFEPEDFPRRGSVAIQLGPPSNGLCDVDLDCKEARALAHHLLPATRAIFGRGSTPAAHHLFYSDAWERAQNVTLRFDDPRGAKGEHGACLLELRTGRVERSDGKGDVVKGALSVFPGSRHPSGELIQWERDSDGEPARVDGDKLVRAVTRLAVATLLARYYPKQGLRHGTALVLGGTLARAGMSEKQITNFVSAIGKIADDEEVHERARSAASAVDLLQRGEKTPGLPRLGEVWGNDIAEAVGAWLDISRNGKRRHKNGNASDEKPRKQVDILIDLACRCDLFHDPSGAPFIEIEVGEHEEILPVNSKRFQRWLARQSWLQMQTAPSSEALNSAIRQIEARACYDGAERPVFSRVGRSDDGALYLDLADSEWRAVRITADEGWRVVDRPRVRFVRKAGMLPLPEPITGGTIDELRPFVNVKSNADFVLVVSWLLAALRDCGPFPVLVVSGGAGVAKSSTLRALHELVDPNTSILRAPPKSDRDVFIAGNNAHVISYDNLSSLPIWLSDTICRLATRGGFGTRALWTDDEERLFNVTRPVLLGGRRNVVAEGDLAERALQLRLPPIKDEARRDEGTFWSAYYAARPRILGALLDAIVYGLRRLPQIKLERLPRMADFAKWAVACEGALPWPPGTFMRAYEGNRSTAIADVLEGNAVARALPLLLRKFREWTGTATELLAELNALVTEQEHADPDWPKAPNTLSGILTELSSDLAQVGIVISVRRHTERRVNVFTIRQSAKHRSDRSDRSKDNDFNEVSERSPSDDERSSSDLRAMNGRGKHLNDKDFERSERSERSSAEQSHQRAGNGAHRTAR